MIRYRYEPVKNNMKNKIRMKIKIGCSTNLLNDADEHDDEDDNDTDDEQ